MRKTLAITTAALLLTGGTQLPAVAVAPDAPTDLQLGWSDLAHHQVKISWSDHGEANRVRIEYENGGMVTKPLVKADQPNEYVKVSSGIVVPDRVARIGVVSVDDAGVESVPTWSPWLDSYTPAFSMVTLAEPLADGSLKLEWVYSELPTDTTPNDPLDRPASEMRVLLSAREGGDSTNGVSVPLPSETTAATLPPQPYRYFATVQTLNEWGLGHHPVGTPGTTTVMFKTATVGLKVPAVATYASSVAFTATAGVGACPDPNAGCGAVNPLVSDAGVVPELQMRPNATKPWTTVARYNNQQPNFTGSFPAIGGGEYRLYVPKWSRLVSWKGSLGLAASTSPRRIAVQAKFLAASFNTSTAAVSQPVKATVSIQPATTTNADLQWYDGTRWRHSVYIALVNGKGTSTFKAAGRGTTHSWRVVTPALTYNGLPIAATTSKTFKLTVR